MRHTRWGLPLLISGLVTCAGPESTRHDPAQPTEPRPGVPVAEVPETTAGGGFDFGGGSPDSDGREGFDFGGSTETPAEAGEVVYEKHTEVDFGDDTIDGKLSTPDGQYLEARKAQPDARSGYAYDIEEVVDDARNKEEKKSAEKTKTARVASERARILAQLRRVRPGEELWVIAKAPRGEAPTPAPGEPGSGELRTRVPGATHDVPLPLTHTDVRAQIDAYLASVTVTQKYQNPYDGKIEAVYVFPLPDDAAVSELVMVIGTRRIRGFIREREEAERMYRAARDQGYVASLLTQARPNVFTQKVANLEPQARIDVEITYFHTLPYRDGAYVFRFPMVVGPRYNPAGSTQGVGAVARGARGASGQATEVSYLAPEERSGHDLSLAVDLDAGMRLEGVQSSTHAIDIAEPSESRRHITLQQRATIPNKDFVLRYRVAGGQVRTAFMHEHGAQGGHFTLVLQPPAELTAIPRMPREMIFVLDTSGSMAGVPIAKAKRAVRRVLDLLDPDDTFQIINFSSTVSALGPAPVAATQKNVARGRAYLEELEGEGGTEMLSGIRAALEFPHADGRLRVVSFMTDGYIGNEDEILAAIHARLGASRIFSFGVGSSVNTFLLEEMARVGRGAVAYVELDDQASDAAVDAFYERIAYPALADIEIDWGNLGVTDVYPSTPPDLHVGRPVVLTGRYRTPPSGEITVRGRAGTRAVSFRVPLSAEARPRPAIPRIWARMRIADLSDQALARPDVTELASSIRTTALQYGLMSAYTAFVSVDSSRVTQGAHGTTVDVPVPVPDGVRYETTVNSSENAGILAPVRP